ncbi:toxic anion resistance protein [Xanthomonas phage XaC1]|nr:toxic anion resistance protein [Xanthomonas phage XaC1]
MSYGNLFKDKNTSAKETTVIDAEKNTSTGTFEQSVKSLPVLKDSKGNIFNMTLTDIPKFGVVKDSKMQEINNQILNKTMVADSGVMAQGFTQIMALTDKVDFGLLQETNGKVGFIASIRNKFIDKKAQVTAQFTTVRTQITAIAASLQEKVKEMEQEGIWLEQAYRMNIEEIKEWEQNKVLVENALAQAEKYLGYLGELDDSSTEEIEETRIKVNALSSQADTVRKMHMLSTLAAPEIRMMQVTNYNNLTKFNNIIGLSIPFWEKKMSLALTSEKQRQSIAQGAAMDDFTNKLIEETAKQVGKNMVDSANAAQRGIADVDIMVEATNVIVNAMKEAVQIDKNGNETRRQNAVKIEDSMNKMKEALRTI